MPASKTVKLEFRPGCQRINLALINDILVDLSEVNVHTMRFTEVLDSMIQEEKTGNKAQKSKN